MAPRMTIFKGDTFETNYGKVTVIDAPNSREIKVRFENTGTITKTTAQLLKKGTVADIAVSKIKKGGPSPTLFVGDIFTSKLCGDFEIIAYRGALDIDVRFIKTGFTKTVKSEHVTKGHIKDPYAITVCSVGFVGEGYPVSKNGEHMREYHLWRHMLMRVYDQKELAKNPHYKDCSVHIDWHSYQQFVKDIELLPNYYQWKNNPGWELDKDILIPGNRNYSKKTCIFVTKADNIKECSYRRSKNTSMLNTLRNNVMVGV